MLDCRLTQDMIYELSPSLDLSDARTLDLPSCGVRSVDLSPFDLLKNLARYECFLVSGVSFEVGSNVKLYTVLCRHNIIVCVLDNGRHGLHLKVCTHDYHNIICMSLVSSECVYFLPLTLFSLNLLFLPPPPLLV